MLVYLKRLVQERSNLSEIMTRMADKAAQEDRDLSDVENGQITEMQTRCAQIDEQLKSHNDIANGMRAFAQLTEGFAEQESVVAQRSAVRRENRTTEAVSPGEAYVNSDQFRSYRGYGTSDPYEIADYLQLRALVTTADLSIPAYAWSGPREPTVSTPLLDVLGVVRVSSGNVEWVEVGQASNAAVVAEGAAKPEATIPMSPQSAALDTIAHWVQITRQALEDASYIRSMIEGKLRQGLLNKIQADAAAALVAANIPAATVPAGGKLTEAIRVGVANVESAGFNPNAVVMNPADYAQLDLDVMGMTVAGPARQTTVWGLRVVPAPVVSAGTAFVGDFQAGFTLFDRGVSNVFTTDSHADNFVKNVLIILAESRVKSVVTDVNAIAECTVAAGLP